MGFQSEYQETDNATDLGPILSSHMPHCPTTDIFCARYDVLSSPTTTAHQVTATISRPCMKHDSLAMVRIIDSHASGYRTWAAADA
jgi:hypothetical protein